MKSQIEKGQLANLLHALFFCLLIMFPQKSAAIGPYLSDNVTITDQGTDLQWQAASHSNFWEGGLVYCEALSLLGFDDWRLPDIKELSTIVEEELADPPSIDTTYFSAELGNYWSSTTNNEFPNQAWSIDFTNGSIVSLAKSVGNVRCVRGGEC